MSQRLSDFLDYYLDSAPAGERAVLVTGPWGSGKTHFIRAYMQARDDRRRSADPLRRKHLYASLYGVRTPADVADRVFAVANPGLNSWPIKLMAGAAARAGNIFARGRLFAADDGPRLRKTLVNLWDAVLVFDDMERAAMPLDELMGFINDYVENHAVRCVLIANEAEIADAEGEYTRRKEKLVGWTMSVETVPADVISTFGGKLRSPEAQATVERTLPSLVSAFQASGQNNYRFAKDILDAFDRLLISADPKLKDSAPALNSLLPFLMASGLELRSGGLKRSDLTQLAGGERSLEEAKRRHPIVDWLNPVIPSEAWGDLLIQGQLDVEAIDARVNVHPLVVGTANTPNWRRLWDWRGCKSRAEFDEVCAGVIADLEAQRLDQPGEILHVAGTAMDMKESGYGLFGDQSVTDYMGAYLDRLSAADRLTVDRSLFDDWRFYSYDGLGFTAKEDPEFLGFYSRVEGAVEAAFARKVEGLAPNLMADLRAGKWGVLTEASLDLGGVAEVPILHHLDVIEFADLMMLDARHDRTLLTVLGMRYRRHVADGQPFEAERTWLIALRDELLSRAEQQAAPHRAWNLKQLSEKFEAMLVAFGEPGVAERAA